MDDALLHGGLMSDVALVGDEIVRARRPPRISELEASSAWSWVSIGSSLRIWVIHRRDKKKEIAESVMKAANKLHETYHRHSTRKGKAEPSRKFLDL